MVAGMRSLAKAMELPPEPNVRAPALDPTLGEGAAAMPFPYPTPLGWVAKDGGKIGG
jgi:hypothetical protein